MFRQYFPIFEYHPGLVWLDNAATTHKPHSVIEAEANFYKQQNANVRRGIYPLAAEATELFEAARTRVARFLNARSPAEIVFTSGTTAGINLMAHGFAKEMLHPGHAIVVTAMEHHANLIPWQQACQQSSAQLLVAPVLPNGTLDMVALAKTLAAPHVRLLAVTHISNTLGTVNPMEKIIALAQEHGVPVLMDAAQSIVYEALDVQSLGVDFLVFSGHKMFGPTGTGVLFAKYDWLERLPTWQTGGDMILDVSWEHTVFAPPPQKFEAGTPNIAGAIGLVAAIDFIENMGQKAMRERVHELLDYATEELQDLPGLEIVGTAPEKSGIVSFVLDGIHPHDVATFLGQSQVCVRAGLHCTQPLLDFLGHPGGTVRASFAAYNSRADVDRLVDGLRAVRRILG